ncbi:MAG: thioredoxin domain-containing protein [Alphaproteobacteria bacterium]|nr:thioredoxin domain-containing protein [Alphaproteobacteria bacterium]
MASRRNLLIGGIGAAVVAAGGWIAIERFGLLAPATHKTPAKPPLLGNVTAPKRLVVWGSYTCPFTAQLFVMLRSIVADMPQTASVEWRHFPIHKPDPALQVAGLGFEGDHFWGFTFRVLNLVLKAGGMYSGLTRQKLDEFAAAEGGSDETFKAAYADPAKWAAVKEDLLAGRLLGVTRTPGLFYNGYFLTPTGLPANIKGLEMSLRKMLQTA